MSKILFAILILSASVFAQTRQPSTTNNKIVVVRADEMKKGVSELKENERKDFFTESGLYSQFWIESKSNRIDEAEVHDASDDYHVILEGETTYIIGGKLVEPKEIRPGEWRSAKVEGGERVTVKKGDTLFVPRGTVHQRDSTGKSVKYQIIKVHANPVEQRKPTPAKPAETPKPMETPKPTAEVTRKVLMQATPQAFSGWEILFRRITLPPGAGNNGEVHPGMQIVHVESGVMSLKILGGQMKLKRAEKEEYETLTAPNEYEIRKGDTLHEQEACVHAPRNNANEPLVILVASLIPKGAEPTNFLKEN
jgi:mannose-6-phosphate isomerase-like protein (cupin superfamily)